MLRAVLLVLCSSALTAQVASHPEFEVASVKPISEPRGLHNTVLSIMHGQVNADWAALRQLTGLAYGIQRVRVVGGPGWMDSDLYKIVAKAENPDANPEEVRQMLQALLAERFKLAVHPDTKQGTVYRLVQAKGGSKLQEATEPGKPHTSPGPPGTAQFGGQPFIFRNMSLAGLVNTVANVLGSPVHDETGLEGRYNFTLEWAIAPPAPRQDAAGFRPTADPGPSIFDALQEQLGLKLEPSKGPIDILVVDHAEKATPN